MIAKLKDGIAEVKSLTIVGHTDLLGTKTYNQRLSEARAHTVKLYMVERGVRIPISSEGRGLTEPVKTCKMLKPFKERIDFLQPNRRVEVSANFVFLPISTSSDEFFITFMYHDH